MLLLQFCPKKHHGINCNIIIADGVCLLSTTLNNNNSSYIIILVYSIIVIRRGGGGGSGRGDVVSLVVLNATEE